MMTNSCLLSYLLTMVTSSCLSFIFARYGDEFLFIFWVFKKVFIFTFVHSSYPILIFVLNIFSSNYFITVLIFPTFLRNFRIRQWQNCFDLLSCLSETSGIFTKFSFLRNWARCKNKFSQNLQDRSALLLGKALPTSLLQVYWPMVL